MNYYWQQNHEILLGWEFQLFQLDILYSIVPENIYNFPAEEILLLTPLKILITLHRFLFLLVMQNPSPIARKIQSFLWGWGLEDMVIFWNYTLNSLDFRTSLYLPVLTFVITQHTHHPLWKENLHDDPMQKEGVSKRVETLTVVWMFSGGPNDYNFVNCSVNSPLINKLLGPAPTACL